MIEQLQEMEVARQEMKRKAFLVELEGRGFNFTDKSHDEFGFNDETLNMVWEMWQAAQEQMLKNLYTRKMVCAIENRVQEQMDASGVQEPLHRLDGWTIVDSIVENINFPKLSETHVLVPKKEVCDFYVANHLKGTTCSVDVSNLTGNDGDRIYGKLFDYDCIGSDGNTLIYALESSNFKLAKNKGNSGDYVLVKKSTIQAIHQSCENALDMAAVWAKDAALCTIRDEVELLQK